jgi:hypothetical protein
MQHNVQNVYIFFLSLFVTNLANIINLKSCIGVTNQYITTCQLVLDFKHTNLYLMLLLTLMVLGTNLWCLSSPDFIFSKSTDSIQLNKNRMCISSLFQDYIKFPNIFYDCCRTINVNSSIRYRLVCLKSRTSWHVVIYWLVTPIQLFKLIH